MTLRNNIIANYVGQGWSALMNIAFVPIYVRYLGIESYALIGIYAALQAWLALLDLGMSPTLQREMARFRAGSMTPAAIRDLLRSVEWVCAALAALAAVTIGAAAGILAAHWFTSGLPDGVVKGAMIVMGLVVALRFLESVYRSALFGLEQQVWFNAVNVVLNTARFGGAALIAMFVSADITAFFWWQLAISVIALAMLRGKLGRLLPRTQYKPRFSTAALHDVKRFAIGMVGINLTALVLTQADKVILSRLLTLTAFGHYTLAITMCGIVVALTGPVVQAAYPSMVRLYAGHDQAGFMSVYHRAAQMLAVAAASVAGLLAIFATEILWVWTGDHSLVAATAPLLSLFAAGTLCNALMQVPYFGLLAVGETRFPVRANLVAAVCLIVALLLTVPIYGAIAGSAAWLGLNIGYLLIGLPLLHRHHLRGALHPWFMRDTLPPVIAIIAVYAFARTATLSLVGDRAIWLCLLLLIGAMGSAAGLLATTDLRRLALGFVGQWRRGDGAPLAERIR